ncbi:MAG: hypothetical protein KAV82_10330 [Phycisphaerae bacterium]|nr:hypothetical protein [Phycisphaerae bacterium]
MNAEFHYWITGIIAQAAGFSDDEAGTIAYASQYVDDNDISYSVEGGDKPYVNFISQTLNILKPKRERMRIYPIFHFVPGDALAPSARRHDGKMHVLNTTPNSELVQAFMDAAFRAKEDNRPYRIGIATHAYVDSWAHQNFVGWLDSFNKLGTNLIPNIGHADATTEPDRVNHRWPDERLVDPGVVNNDRFLAAAQCLFEWYSAYLDARGRACPDRPPWDQLQVDLASAMSEDTEQNRIVAYRRLAPWLSDYCDARWFDASIGTEVRGLKDSHGTLGSLVAFFVDKLGRWARDRLRDRYYWHDPASRTSTDWYQFQRAVKAHERLGIRKLDPIFTQLGVQISQR